MFTTLFPFSVFIRNCGNLRTYTYIWIMSVYFSYTYIRIKVCLLICKLSCIWVIKIDKYDTWTLTYYECMYISVFICLLCVFYNCCFDLNCWKFVILLQDLYILSISMMLHKVMMSNDKAKCWKYFQSSEHLYFFITTIRKCWGV